MNHLVKDILILRIKETYIIYLDKTLNQNKKITL